MSTRTRKKIQSSIGYSNSTTAESFNSFKSGELYVTVKDVSNFNSITLRDAPEQKRHQKVQAKEAVVKSLERSIAENADIWTELSKH